ncbi:uncharacterized protein LOC115884830 isoform X2 [Sitophilus oryzae]|uniref:Uncharacterized protein LOC115884830 isoform X2 n=1 Tax=Sitophilus oryzae TaxID=7048 RepID=A0A6J2Y859_SITOR|nr:uncharacterized protein LOC115884830 isoform X2 [Sitophilus oryzae]
MYFTMGFFKNFLYGLVFVTFLNTLGCHSKHHANTSEISTIVEIPKEILSLFPRVLFNTEFDIAAIIARILTFIRDFIENLFNFIVKVVTTIQKYQLSIVKSIVHIFVPHQVYDILVKNFQIFPKFFSAVFNFVEKQVEEQLKKHSKELGPVVKGISDRILAFIHFIECFIKPTSACCLDPGLPNVSPLENIRYEVTTLFNKWKATFLALYGDTGKHGGSKKGKVP